MCILPHFYTRRLNIQLHCWLERVREGLHSYNPPIFGFNKPFWNVGGHLDASFSFFFNLILFFASIKTGLN